MRHTPPSFSISHPGSVVPPASTPSEGIWAISVVQHVEPVPTTAHDEAEEAAESGWRSWLPTRAEGLAGAAFGAILGAMIFGAVALDLEDFTPPAAPAARTGHFLVGGTRALDVQGPVTAERRDVPAAPLTRPSSARGARRAR
ncbi:MAG: hypothetical protein JST00_07215 [Deltaproteobacteria bacterium]|nr:hypothetical protein [Deltaproteobacteria bacterium]